MKLKQNEKITYRNKEKGIALTTKLSSRSRKYKGEMKWQN